MFGIIKKIIKIAKRNSAEKKYGNMKFEKIQFGSYPQSDPKTSEPIEWLILKTENGKMLLLSDKILHSMSFGPDNSNYDNSDVRKWLNGQFYNTAFSEEEKLRIVTLSDNDRVSLISYNELRECLPADSLRRRQVTNVAKRQKSPFNKKTGMGSWMLSTTLRENKYSALLGQIVGSKGEIDPLPISSFIKWGVVPAIIIEV